MKSAKLSPRYKIYKLFELDYSYINIDDFE